MNRSMKRIRYSEHVIYQSTSFLSLTELQSILEHIRSRSIRISSLRTRSNKCCNHEIFDMVWPEYYTIYRLSQAGLEKSHLAEMSFSKQHTGGTIANCSRALAQAIAIVTANQMQRHFTSLVPNNDDSRSPGSDDGKWNLLRVPLPDFSTFPGTSKSRARRRGS